MYRKRGIKTESTVKEEVEEPDRQHSSQQAQFLIYL